MTRYYELCPASQELITSIVNTIASAKGLPYQFETLAVLAGTRNQLSKLSQLGAREAQHESAK